MSVNRASSADRFSRSWCQPRRRPHRKGCCLDTRTPPDRPDPATYSQLEQLSLGIQPTWNSPDITTNFYSPYTLFKEPEFKVRNLSATASAVNTLVHVSTSPFGLGMQRTPLLSQVVTLGPSQEVTLLYPLPQAVLNGDQRIGVHVRIEHPHDKNKLNSVASQIIFAVHTSQVGRNFQQQFPVLNFAGSPRAIQLSVLSSPLTASVSPAAHTYAPFEQLNATLSVQVPNSLHGAPNNVLEREVTVVGRGPGGEVIDGITYVVRIDD
ncbi:MAG TPA: hypothetical protein VM864_02535 [Pyrinomonadaceae bacterium]|jgi:hypothetical protein|nr:hypothetical protein [Pyrinomonadaceae bacterium]